MSFAEILARFLRQENLTQAEFARKVGVATGQVCEWLRGKCQPGYATLRQICAAFNMSADFWLGRTDEY